MIKIGIEASHRKLRCDILRHPERYFFILVRGGKAFLCVKTCDAFGEDIIDHAIDGQIVEEDGNLHSIFSNQINDAILEMDCLKTESPGGYRYPINYDLANCISLLPDMAEWIIYALLSRGRNLVILT